MSIDVNNESGTEVDEQAILDIARYALARMRIHPLSELSVIVVDADRPPKRHGMPPKLLTCEFAAIGLKLHRLEPLAGGESYFAAFRLAGPRPEPSQIRPCKGKS